MTRQCGYCDRWFKNKQAIRAHLKHCATWQQSAVKAKRNLELTLGLKLGSVPRSPSICVGCGTPSTDPSICTACGSRYWLPPESKPRQCPKCSQWSATDGRPWNGCCDHCGEAMSEAALRAERDALRVRLGHDEG